MAIFETSNSLQSASVLQVWISYLGEKAGLSFDTTTYRGLAVSSERGDDQHYVVMDDYMLFATDRVLLEDTIDRIKDANTAGSLFASSRFQDARETLTSPRPASRRCTWPQGPSGGTPAGSWVTRCLSRCGDRSMT